MIWSFLTCFFIHLKLYIWSLPILMNISFISGYSIIQFSQFSCSVMSNSLRPHESQHARPPCPSPTLGLLDHTKFIHSSMKEYFIVSRFLLLKAMLIEDPYEVFLKPWTQFYQECIFSSCRIPGSQGHCFVLLKLLNVCDKQKNSRHILSS